VSFELRDVSPDHPDVLYAFIGARSVLSKQEVQQRLLDSGVASEAIDKVIDLLLWFGFLGVMTRGEDEPERYSYRYQHSLKRMFLGLYIRA
jgi:hypothetical protein